MHVHFQKLMGRAGLGAAAAVAVAGFGLGPAQAALAEPGIVPVPVPCSAAALVSAVTNAPSGSTLILAPGCFYVLDAGLPAISKTLTFVGPATLVRSDAEETPNFSIMTVDEGGQVLLHNVSFLGGRATGKEENSDGGAIDNDGGAVFVNGGLFRYNYASDEGPLRGRLHFEWESATLPFSTIFAPV